MKRTVIFVSVFSVGVIVIFSMIGNGIITVSQTTVVPLDGIDATLEFEIDFNYTTILGIDWSEFIGFRPYININVVGDNIYFKQVCYIYLNANASNFWLDGLGNSSTISILEIFEPTGSVARGIKSILIKGVIRNINYESFTLQFIDVNKHVHQNQTIESFKINM